MQISRENIATLTDKITIKLATTDYLPKVEKSLKKYAQKVDVKGFRKGLVPVGMVKKMYGNSILAEEINTLLQDELFKYIEDQKIEILGQPLPVNDQKINLEINTPEDYEFQYEIGVQPSFALNHLEAKPSYDQEAIAVDAKMLDEEIDMLRKRFGKNDSPDDIQENDIVYIELKEVDADSADKEEAFQNATSFNVNMLLDTPKKKEFMAMKKGDSIVLNVFEAFDKSREDVMKFILNAKPEQYEQLGDFYKMTVSNVNRLQLAELDEAFFAQAFPGGDVTSEEQMRAKITADLKDYFMKSTERTVLQQLAKDLIEKTTMEFPADFLKRWIKASNEKPISDEQIEKEFESFTKELKWSLICGKVIKEQNLEVTPDEIKHYTRQMVQSQLIQYGLGQMPDEQLDNFGKRYMEDKKHIQKTHELLLEEKVMNHLKQFIVINEKPISLEDYNKKMEASNKEEVALEDATIS
ncbi:MAG: trigger factor [Bacteroidota bacterium]